MNKTPAIETELYDGKINVKFFPDSHIYMVNGKRKTGVTTIIGIKDKSRPLVIWATELYRDFLFEALENGKVSAKHIEDGCKLHSVRKEEAATLGSLAHDWIEQHVKGNNPDMPEDARVVTAINAFLDWEKQHKVKFVSTERVVYSKKHDFIGKMDAEAIVDGKRALVDFKTSSGLYNTVRMQTAAYQMADEEEGTKKYQGRWAIRIAKEDEKEYHARMAKKGKTEFPAYVAFEAKFFDADSLEDDYKAFLSCQTLYNWDSKTDFYKLAKNGK